MVWVGGATGCMGLIGHVFNTDVLIFAGNFL